MPKSVLRVALENMQFTLLMQLAEHLTALRAWCKQHLPAWCVKTRRAPSRHSRDARVHGHTTTAMHKLSTSPRPPPPSPSTFAAADDGAIR